MRSILTWLQERWILVVIAGFVGWRLINDQLQQNQNLLSRFFGNLVGLALLVLAIVLIWTVVSTLWKQPIVRKTLGWVVAIVFGIWLLGGFSGVQYAWNNTSQLPQSATELTRGIVGAGNADPLAYDAKILGSYPGRYNASGEPNYWVRFHLRHRERGQYITQHSDPGNPDAWKGVNGASAAVWRGEKEVTSCEAGYRNFVATGNNTRVKMGDITNDIGQVVYTGIICVASDFSEPIAYGTPEAWSAWNTYMVGEPWVNKRGIDTYCDRTPYNLSATLNNQWVKLADLRGRGGMDYMFFGGPQALSAIADVEYIDSRSAAWKRFPMDQFDHSLTYNQVRVRAKPGNEGIEVKYRLDPNNRDCHLQ